MDGLLGVAGGCWDDDITNVMKYGSFPNIPCVKRTSKFMKLNKYSYELSLFICMIMYDLNSKLWILNF